MQIKIQIDTERLSRELGGLSSRGLNTAARQAINKTVTGVRTDATRYLTEKTGSKKQATLRKRFKIEKASQTSLRGALVIPDVDLPLSNVKGLRVSAGGRRVTWNGKRIKAFRIDKVGALNNDLFFRVKGRKSPVRGYAYTLLQSYRRFEAGKHLVKTGSKRLEKNLQASLKYQLRRVRA